MFGLTAAFEKPTSERVTKMLEAKAVVCSYGDSQVVNGISLSVRRGEVVTLLGRNGMGKNTFIKALMGIVPLSSGIVELDGANLSCLPSHKVAQAGIGYVPEGRRIFPNLSVRENLLVAARHGTNDTVRWTFESVFELFPGLLGRLDHGGEQLSGGEQQMVAIGRALLTNPKLLILDEATEGLAPLIRDAIWQCLKRLKDTGLAILVVDKNIDHLVKLAERHYVLEKGEVIWEGNSTAIVSYRDRLERSLGI
jgi:branched-chain amino acid transport system ATP-binding protein